MRLEDGFLHWAQAAPGAPAVVDGAEPWTYGGLHEHAPFRVVVTVVALSMIVRALGLG